MTKILDTLSGNPSFFPPIWLMRQAGRYLPEYHIFREKLPSFMDLCFHEDYATEVTLQPLRRFDLDAAILFSDILVIPHILGQPVHFIKNQGPVLEPIDEKNFFDKAKDIDVKTALAVPLKILSNVRSALPSTKTMIGFAGSPWTIATYMMEQGKSSNFSKILSLLSTRNSLFTQTMSLLEEAVGTFLIAQIEAGAHVVQIFDSWAKAVPNTDQEEWIVKPVRRIITRIRKEHPNVPILYYGRGAHCLYSQITEGMSSIALGVDEEVPVSVMKNDLQTLGTVQGNLNPHLLVEGGERMKTKVCELLQAFQGTPYIFNLGHGVLPQTPVDHVSDLIDLVKGSL